MKVARIAAPGMVLGRHPERPVPDAASPLLRGAVALWHGVAGSRQRRHRRFVAAVRRQQGALAQAAPERLRGRAAHVRAQLAREGLTGAALAEAFALMALTCRHTLGVEPYDTQLFAAHVMLDGQLAEMATGEGKTLAAALAAAAAAWAGIPVHVLTANDYLVERDAAALRALYAALGLTVGAVTQRLPAAARRAAYACDITYCTAKELVFDYLRDGVAAPRHSPLQQHAAALAGAPVAQRLLRGLNMAIVDEADSILIDEARVPLVLSQALGTAGDVPWRQAWDVSAALVAGHHFGTDAAACRAWLTAAGRERVRGPGALKAGAVWLNARHFEDAVTLALTARHLLRQGRDYVVADGRVHIVDATTGRKAAGRMWSQGLQQLVDIKEGCAASAPLATLAQISYQRFFPRYFRLCGMSGTLTEARHELQSVYGLAVTAVPLRRPSRRAVWPARVYASADALWPAVVARVRELHLAGRPVLVGTDSVADSESLSRHLAAAALAHTVLNAQQDQREAQIVAAAGELRAITVATNMAGRGTDILLSDASRAAGGLHVICCQQNAARRIDRQLMGRCARQGDPGSVERYIVLDGPLLARLPAGNVFNKLFKNRYLGIISAVPWLLRRAQRSAERRDRRERALLMQRDQQMSDWFAFSGNEG